MSHPCSRPDDIIIRRFGHETVTPVLPAPRPCRRHGRAHRRLGRAGAATTTPVPTGHELSVLIACPPPVAVWDMRALDACHPHARQARGSDGDFHAGPGRASCACQHGPMSARVIPGWDEYFLGIAAAVSVRASCVRRVVGAVLVVDRRIIATGYNGAAPGEPDCLSGACPRGHLTYDQVPGLGDYDRPGTPGFCIAIHAEINALLFATRDTKGAVAYITDPPCPGCRKALAAAGIVRAVWPGGEFDRSGLTRW